MINNTLIQYTCLIKINTFRNVNSIIIDNDVYINWNSFASIQWKRSTLKGLIYREHVVYSEKPILDSELKCLRSFFHKFNGYPHWFITKIMTEVKIINNNLNKEITVKKQIMVLPHGGEKGLTLVKSLKKDLQMTLPSNIQTEIVYNSMKLSLLLNNSKDIRVFGKKRDVV